MPFVPHGKKPQRHRQQTARREAEERVFDRVIGRAQFAVRHAPRRCLQLCFLVERVLDQALPGHPYRIRLGALRVVPGRVQPEPITFDPRDRDGAAPAPGRLPAGAGFHSWLENPVGRLLDPSIFLTLHAEGIAVDREGYLQANARAFQHAGIGYEYEVLPEMEPVGVAESEEHLARGVSLVLSGHPLDLGPHHLDVEWRPRTPTR